MHHSYKHGHAGRTYGKRIPRSPTYASWVSMKDRCFNPKATRYELYGGKGITVCARWKESFTNFLEDMGERPKGTSLGRIGDRGNYEPGNCTWQTILEQNQTRNVPKGDDCTSSKTNSADVIALREEYAAGGISMRNLGKKYNLSFTQTQRIIRRQAWAHV